MIISLYDIKFNLTSTLLAGVMSLDFILYASTMEFHTSTISTIPFTFALLQMISICVINNFDISRAYISVYHEYYIS